MDWDEQGCPSQFLSRKSLHRRKHAIHFRQGFPRVWNVEEQLSCNDAVKVAIGEWKFHNAAYTKQKIEAPASERLVASLIIVSLKSTPTALPGLTNGAGRRRKSPYRSQRQVC